MKRSWLLLIVLLLTTTCIAADAILFDETTSEVLVDEGCVVSNQVIVQPSSEYLLDAKLKSTSFDPFRIGPPPDPFPTEPDEPVSVNGGLICLLMCVMLYAGFKLRRTSCK